MTEEKKKERLEREVHCPWCGKIFKVKKFLWETVTCECRTSFIVGKYLKGDTSRVY